MPTSSFVSEHDNLGKDTEKASAIARLDSELAAGFTSGDENGWISDAEVDEHFKNKVH